MSKSKSSTPPSVKTVDARPAESLTDRFVYCAGMLHVHDLITDSERVRIQQRIAKRLAKQTKS